MNTPQNPQLHKHIVMPRCCSCKYFVIPEYRPINTKIGLCTKLKEEHENFWKPKHKSTFEIFTQFNEIGDFDIEVLEDFGCVLHNEA